MTNHKAFTHTPPELMTVLEELRRREPIFHTPEFGTGIADFERAMSPEYWEVGASGRRYSREFILRHLAELSRLMQPQPAGEAMTTVCAALVLIPTCLLTH